MSLADRELSSFLAIKGVLVESTYRAFADWDLATSTKANLKRIRETNSIGAPSMGWLRDICKVINRRYEIDGRDRSLVEIVQAGWHMDDWRPVLLWHVCRNDELLRSFLADWLFEQREKGIVLVGAEAAISHLHEVLEKRLQKSEMWTESTFSRAASGLLKAAVEFQLLRGHQKKEFVSYRLPERSFVYLLHEMMAIEKNTKKVVHSRDWRLFFLRPHDVEEELLRLHQFGKLRFERAGSLLELTLPCGDANAYARSVDG